MLINLEPLCCIPKRITDKLMKIQSQSLLDEK